MKVFVARNSYIKAVDNVCIGGRDFNRSSIGMVFATGANKGVALATMKTFGYSFEPIELRIARGAEIEALTTAGVLRDDNLIIVSSSQPVIVAEIATENGERAVSTIGLLQPEQGTYKYTFEPVG